MTEANESDPSKSATVTHTADTRNPDWDKYAPDGHGRTDEQIRADVHQALSGLDGADTGTLAVTVEKGTVTLSGRVSGQADQARIKELVSKVPSVRDVRVQLQG